MTSEGKGAVKARIETKIAAAFAPRHVSVVDESRQHAGHGRHHHHPGGETHFRVEIVSDAFSGKSQLERHRMVYAVLAEELKERVHALAVTAKAPGEAP
ncbi:MAG TPA: BolA family protein [Methylocystis sp.]|nr:BolA family protein [Methylocystis sp.]